MDGLGLAAGDYGHAEGDAHRRRQLVPAPIRLHDSRVALEGDGRAGDGGASGDARRLDRDARRAR